MRLRSVRSFDGTPIAYTAGGRGPAVLLLHGFGADHALNWVAPGIVDALIRAGRLVIAMDVRGHGASGKPHDPESYDGETMVRDVQTVLDTLGVEQIDVVGYSMGAMLAARLIPDEPRSHSLVLGGVGSNVVPPWPADGDNGVAAALLVDDPATISNPTAKALRDFADHTGADRAALAAIDRSSALRFTVRFDAITVPTLIVVGDADALIEAPHRLRHHIAGARLHVVPGDHLSTVYNPAFGRAILDFLDDVDHHTDAITAQQ